MTMISETDRSDGNRAGSDDATRPARPGAAGPTAHWSRQAAASAAAPTRLHHPTDRDRRSMRRRPASCGGPRWRMRRRAYRRDTERTAARRGGRDRSSNGIDQRRSARRRARRCGVGCAARLMSGAGTSGAAAAVRQAPAGAVCGIGSAIELGTAPAGVGARVRARHQTIGGSPSARLRTPRGDRRATARPRRARKAMPDRKSDQRQQRQQEIGRGAELRQQHEFGGGPAEHDQRQQMVGEIFARRVARP